MMVNYIVFGEYLKYTSTYQEHKHGIRYHHSRECRINYHGNHNHDSYYLKEINLRINFVKKDLP
jgi:hypothetical protein